MPDLFFHMTTPTYRSNLLADMSYYDNTYLQIQAAIGPTFSGPVGAFFWPRRWALDSSPRCPKPGGGPPWCPVPLWCRQGLVGRGQQVQHEHHHGARQRIGLPRCGGGRSRFDACMAWYGMARYRYNIDIKLCTPVDTSSYFKYK